MNSTTLQSNPMASPAIVPFSVYIYTSVIPFVIFIASLSFSVYRLTRPPSSISTVLDVLPASESPSHESQYQPPSSAVKVEALYIYPIKSTSSVSLRNSTITRTGLLYDRQFTFATFDTTATSPITTGYGKIPHDLWRTATQREYPKLSLITTSIIRINGVVHITASFPYKTFFSSKKTFTFPYIPSPHTTYEKEKVYIWTETPPSLNFTHHIPPTILSCLRSFLGIKPHIKLGLFRTPPSTPRPILRNPTNIPSVVGFADSYPLHILSSTSVSHLSSLTPGVHVHHNRFRCNILISTPTPYSEDFYTRIRIGSPGVHLKTTTKCVRCKLPNVDQTTGIRDGKNEPDSTLRKTRNVDKGAKGYGCLGIMMVPEDEGVVVKVGDEVEVLEEGETEYIPL